MVKTLILAASLLLASTAAYADDTMKGMDHSMPSNTTSKAPSSKAFTAANARMHKAMVMPMTGNADVDFVRGMIAHHQGAIDMAKVELQYGKDEKIRTLAEEIIKAQQGEIAMMQQWLEMHGQ
ncbi:CopM family metallochaperone [Agrobacterium vitis]|uniref:CopM family metallochaperone n=1 Tax=Rhizobium/Agrobacterium group TaxID=227290 RepID=UPI0012E80392|nr:MULTISPECIES: DUF305 domain-containing protein [Rhizobium/Agrobacterium group]MCF1463266.1 DUF305 domain-containing protein [Allorhizobium ampelinum]MCF1471796.1 DUF305 domain-containing protein [Allorhizobium ampelinum]MVA54189.1 DUF305 domain-containing protein [Agrobacterium vitis]MVA74217.1 DUF305 domain-containing protein [Agrobacterium vitis]NSZ55022.1 DUF305 domain-containing protein [Agrobacterium vitis]